MKRLWWRFRRLFHRDAEWREEVESHIRLSEDWHRASGASQDDARDIARQRFGNRLQTVEAIRAVHIRAWIDTLSQDVRHALRGFRRSPAFTLVAIAAIALGVGAATAVFSAIDLLLFRKLPYPNDRQLVSLGYFGPVDTDEFNIVSSYLQWRSSLQPVFQSLTSMRPATQCDLQSGEIPRQFSCYAVEANFLEIRFQGNQIDNENPARRKTTGHHMESILAHCLRLLFKRQPQ